MRQDRPGHSLDKEDSRAKLGDESISTLVYSAICEGMETSLMQIECGFTRGFAGMQLIGNTSEVSRDGKERARAALESLGIHIPPRRLVVSLTPADIKKDGAQFDLPIAVSLALLITERRPRLDPSRWLFAAELGLSGELRPVKGIVPFALAAMAHGLEGVVVAPDNLKEVEVLAALNRSRLGALKTMSFHGLRDLLAWLVEGDESAAVSCSSSDLRPGEPQKPSACLPNFDDMILHPMLETAALVACSGPHSLLLRGCPGTGKSMFASRLVSILPPMGREEHIEAMRIYSTMTERLSDALLAGRPPFRAPHHQASAAAVLGSPERPGELALAHGGVLFLDEFPEFRRDLLESLREPLETGEIRVSRIKRKVTWKSRLVLVAACNNCPCGWRGSHRQECLCGGSRIQAYLQRLSGPVLDRIDLHVNVPELDASSSDLFIRLARSPSSSKTEEMAARVLKARDYAGRRNAAFGVVFNAGLAAQHLVAASGLRQETFALLVDRYIPKSASSRSTLRALRVARTLADLDESPELRPVDLELAWSWQAERAAQERGDQPPYGR